MLSSSIIYLAVPVIVISYFFYFKDIFYGQTRPNLVSWFLWMLGPFIGVFFILKAGGGLSALPVFMAGLGPLVVVIVSLLRKNSIWKINGFDIFCGILSLMALIIYVLTHNLGVSIVFAILSDAWAFTPTYIKAWKFPKTEHSGVYSASIFSNILALLIIKNWIFVIYSFSIYLIIANMVMMFILYRKKILSLIQ